MKLGNYLPVMIAGVLTVWTSGNTAWAWGKEGHRIVGRIAELHLTPQATDAIDILLNGSASTNGIVRISDDAIANWADHVRYAWTNSAPWHYVDIPYDATAYDPIRDCTNHQGCVVEAIQIDLQHLADKSEPAKQRLTSLKLLVHFVGDIHQPLHCIYRRFGDHEDDRGGNLCMVGYLNSTTVTNLHVIWDTCLIQQSLADTKCDPLQYADLLNKQITPSDENEWQAGTPEDWAWQSHEFAISNAYAGIPTNGLMVTVDAAYVKRNQALVDRQLMRAGIRLARLLNDIFK